MKIFLDRRSCNCWDAPCESHFGWHFLREEITPVDCTLEILDDGKPATTFFILDRDGIDKTLVVDESNHALAYDSWQSAWDEQNKTKKLVALRGPRKMIG
jgi:sugar/nucleoside kinase (ribokinase family)